MMFHATEQELFIVKKNVTPALFAGTSALAIVLNVLKVDSINNVQFPTLKSSSVDMSARYYALIVHRVRKGVIKSVLIKPARKVAQNIVNPVENHAPGHVHTSSVRKPAVKYVTILHATSLA